MKLGFSYHVQKTYKYWKINIRENRSAIKNGQNRDTGNIGYQNKLLCTIHMLWSDK
jgi:hypothetical protein